MSQKRSISTLLLQLLVLSTGLLLLSGPAPVEAGKKQKILLGLAVGHALSSRARDHSILKLIIPLRFAAEAWKKYGEIAAHSHGHYGHHGYGHHGHLDYGFEDHDHYHIHA